MYRCPLAGRGWYPISTASIRGTPPGHSDRFDNDFSVLVIPRSQYHGTVFVENHSQQGLWNARTGANVDKWENVDNLSPRWTTSPPS